MALTGTDPALERRRRAPAGAAVLRADVTAAIARAAFREWARVGYGALAMEAVARRAGVGKAALYRRWPSKAEMVAYLLERAGTPLAAVPDLGSLRDEIRALLTRTVRVLRRPLVRRIVADLHAEMQRSPALAQAVRSGIQVGRRSLGQEMLERAVSRGDLPATLDRELALDLLAALVYWRLVVTGADCGLEHIERLADLVLAALGACRQVGSGPPACGGRG